MAIFVLPPCVLCDRFRKGAERREFSGNDREGTLHAKNWGLPASVSFVVPTVFTVYVVAFLFFAERIPQAYAAMRCYSKSY